MLGFDRHWNRYWLLEGSCSEAASSDGSPASSWVYVERCQPPPGAQGQTHSKDTHLEEEEELPLGQLAQQAQHDSQEAQRAKRREVQIPDDQGRAASWGCYKTAEHVTELITFLNYRGMSSGLILGMICWRVQSASTSLVTYTQIRQTAFISKSPCVCRPLFRLFMFCFWDSSGGPTGAYLNTNRVCKFLCQTGCLHSCRHAIPQGRT